MTPDSPDAAEAPRVRCYACAELVHPDARKCRWCGEWYADMGSTPHRNDTQMTAAQALVAYLETPTAPTQDEYPDVARPRVDALSLALGSDVSADDVLASKLERVRAEVVDAFGVVTPRVRVLDDPGLAPRAFELRLRGDVVRTGVVPPGHASPGECIAGDVHASILDHLGELLTREDVAELVNVARRESPIVVQELIPNQLSLGALRQVLQGLVAERIPIRDLATILNALADHAVYTKDPVALTEHVRSALGRSICARYASVDGVIHAFLLAPSAERGIMNAIQLNETGQVLMLDPNSSSALQSNLADAIQEHRDAFEVPVICTPPKIRRHVRSLLSRNFPDIVVLSFTELVDGTQVDQLASIDVDAVGSTVVGDVAAGFTMVPAQSPQSDWLVES